jgi:hypothetical protein
MIQVSVGDETFCDWISYTPYDSLANLVSALIVLCPDDGADLDALVNWNAEPTQYEFRFRKRGEDVSLDIVRFPGASRASGLGQVALAASGSYRDVCRPFWKALRALQARLTSDEFESAWRRPFPGDALARLTESMRS